MPTKDKQLYKIQYIAGIVALAAVVIFILTVFAMLRRPGVAECYLLDTQSQSYGWSYEVLQDGETETAQPAYLAEYEMYFPNIKPEAFKITRSLAEEMFMAKLKLIPYNAGVEVFLEEQLLYSDFQSKERNEAGFLILTDEDLDAIRPEFRTIIFSLPEDYWGKELSVMTYFREGDAGNIPVFPFLTSEEVEWALAATETVLPMAALTLYAVFAVMLNIVFVLDISNEKSDYRIILLILFFLFLFLDKAYVSLPGSYSVLTQRMNLTFLTGLYVAPLYLYLALYLRRKWLKYTLCGCTILWFLYRIVCGYLCQPLGYDGKGYMTFFLFFFALAALGTEYLCQDKKKRRAFRWYEAVLLCVSVFLALFLYAEEWKGDIQVYVTEMIISAVRGNCRPAVTFLSLVASIMAVLILVLEFVQRTYQTRVVVQVLEDRSRHAMESYERMVSAEEATYAVRHEMRHHINVLKELLKNQDTERVDGYLNALEQEIDALPVTRYSGNILVNVIAGTYLDQARKLGIDVQYQFAVPENLDIADEDLCVLLSNMLENALNACKKMDPKAERFIKIVMHKDGKFLYIGCTNSVSADGADKMTAPEREENGRHGYGLAAMQRIAEKYGSILKVDRGPAAFSVKSNLCLKETSG